MNTSALNKSTTYKPKDALRLLGEDIPANQRGRMSRERVAMVQALVAQGFSIEGYAVVKAAPNTPSTTTAPVVERKAPDNEKVIADLYYRYAEGDYKAVTAEGRVFGMREACNSCGLSLMGHTCDSPSVLGYPVEVVPR